MVTYNQFHGEIPVENIGKELRNIARIETSFKIVTGYGSTAGKSKSKLAAIKSLSKMKREGLIKDYIPGEKITELIFDPYSYFSEVKRRYYSILKKDSDSGNDGVIFIFVR